MSAEILVVRRSSASARTTARQVDRRYNKFKRLLLDLAQAQGGTRAVAAVAGRGYRNPNARKSLHGETQVYDLCAQRTFCPLTVSAGYKPAGRTGRRPVFLK